VSANIIDRVVTDITVPAGVVVSGHVILGLTVEDWVLVGTISLIVINLCTKLCSGGSWVYFKIKSHINERKVK